MTSVRTFHIVTIFRVSFPFPFAVFCSCRILLLRAGRAKCGDADVGKDRLNLWIFREHFSSKNWWLGSIDCRKKNLKLEIKRCNAILTSDMYVSVINTKAKQLSEIRDIRRYKNAFSSPAVWQCAIARETNTERGRKAQIKGVAKTEKTSNCKCLASFK